VGALWLRWTWRDLKSRWPQVLATALVLGVGIGAFAGLGGLSEWRQRSADASLAAVRAHDLRVDLADGAFVDTGALRDALSTLPPGTVAAAQERMIAPSQIDASTRSRSVLVPARLVGIPGGPGSQPVDSVAVAKGRGGAGAVVLDENFTRFYDLPTAGTVRLAGLGRVRYSGVGVASQYFLIVDESGISGAQSGLAVAYVPLVDAQRAAGRPGQVNQLLVRAGPGVDLPAVERDVRTALHRALPGVGFSVVSAPDEPVTRILYRDARNDQKTYTAFAVLLIAGAALAAFNLVSRVVEAQRREIGIGMALGAEPRLLAVRPLVLGVQIGVLGALAGIPIGVGLARIIESLFKDYLPLPAYASTFPVKLYLIGGLVGAAIPIVAAALPVRRAVSVTPVDAIRTGTRTASGGGVTGALRRLRLPGRPLAQLPLRNLARTPRRTVMTLVALGAVMTAVVAVLGMVDSIKDVAGRQETELLRMSPDRVDVTLTGMVRADGAEVQRIAALPGVRAAEPSLVVGAGVRHGSRTVPVALTFVSPASAVWHPSVEAGRATGDGILLARKAAEDLHVGVGDSVILRHPRRQGDRMGIADTRVRVAGIHGNPVRTFAYMDPQAAPALGLGGLADAVTVVPRPGFATLALERRLFGRPGIASVRATADQASALRTAVDSFSGSIGIVTFIVLGLALLVAFTSCSVSVEERRREYATMFAFGLPVRSGLRVAATESLVTGVLGTLVGVGLGLLVLSWIVHGLIPDSFPDLGAQVALTGGSIVTTVVVGVIAVGVAPLLMGRRLRRMDVPSTLRVME
jgi:putative ABC transport system permease protein